MKGRLRIFDTHTHVGTALHSGRRYSAEDLLRDMDAHEVDRAVVIPFPMVQSYAEAHEEIGRSVLRHADRLVGAICLDPYVGRDHYRDEVRRCVEIWGMKALKLQPQFQPVNVVNERSSFIFEIAAEFKLTVIAHTGSGVPFALPAVFMMPARRFPEVSIVLAHTGGPLLVSEAIVAASFCPNIYLELSSLMPHHVMEVLSHVPSSKLLIGSDLPESQVIEIEKIVRLPVAEEVRQDILWNTAVRLFG